MNDHFDLIIIGGGAGAFAAAIRANELGARALLVNAGLPLGGTCVNVGCVPSKTLIHAASLLHAVRSHGVPGLDVEVKGFDFSRVIEDELFIVGELRAEKYEKVLKGLTHVRLVEGRAAFTSGHEIAVGQEKFAADCFVIAAGSTATAPPVAGLRETGFITHMEALQLKRLPQRLVILGGGPLGVEFGQMFARFGSQVTILQRNPSLVPKAEKELTARLAEILNSEGIEVRTGVEVISVRQAGAEKIVSFEAGDKIEERAADEILLAAGKTPNTGMLALAAAGVEVDGRGAIVVNESYQTSAPHIYAVGDVARLPLRLETTAAREGTLAAENGLTGSRHRIDYRTVPYTIFSDPQLAGVGFTEEEAIKEKGDCICRTLSFGDVPRAIITRRPEGLIKMVTAPENGQIIGVHILAPQAGELIAQAMTLVANGNTIEDVLQSLPMFPTLAESIKLVALSFVKDITHLSCCI